MIDFADESPLLLEAISKCGAGVDENDIVCDNIRCGRVLKADDTATGAKFAVWNGEQSADVSAVLCLACVERLRQSTTVEIMYEGAIYTVPIRHPGAE